MRKHLFLIALICSIFVACGPKPELPTVTTNSVDEITETTARCIGEIVDDGNDVIAIQGFCWGTEQNPTLDDNIIEGAYLVSLTPSECVYFEAVLSELTPSTEYYVRAYATNSEGTSYGENIKFVTLEESEPETPEDPYNGYEYVDMGFPSGVKWATCNVGATAPDGYGEYYAWGEIETKEIYSWQSGCLTYGEKLDDVAGNPEYDVAAAKWGGKWRMPRLQDMYELVTQCTWIWGTTNNGVNGFNVVSNINGNYIFLPAAGFMNTEAAIAAQKEGVLDQGITCVYWTSTPYDEAKINKEACCMYDHRTEVVLRHQGFSIRPVCD